MNKAKFVVKGLLITSVATVLVIMLTMALGLPATFLPRFVKLNFVQESNTYFARTLLHLENLKQNLTRLRLKHQEPVNCDPPFKNVLVAINYNFPHYSSIEMLNEFYEPVFGKVVFCGEQADYVKTINTRAQYIPIPENKGYQGYLCLSYAMKLYPDQYEGYLYTNDDVILNWWTLDGFDRQKIWKLKTTTDKDGMHRFTDPDPPPDNWYWWFTQDTLQRCEQAHQGVVDWVENQTSSNSEKWTYLLANYANDSRNLWGHSEALVCNKYLTDVFYIPMKHSLAYTHVATIYGDQFKVYLEVAVPSITMFLIDVTTPEKDYSDLRGEYFLLKTGYSEYYYSGKAVYDFYDIDSTFIHPVKYGRNKLKLENQYFFRHIVMTYSKHALEHRCLWRTVVNPG